MSCTPTGVYKKKCSIKATIKFNVLISSFSDIFIVFVDNNANILGKYSLNASVGYDNTSVKVSLTDPKWLEVYIDTTVTANAVTGSVYNMEIDYRVVNSNYLSGVDVKILESPVLQFID